MRVVNMVRFVLSRRGRALNRLSRSSREMYRVFFLARAGETGLLAALAKGGGTVAELARERGLDPDGASVLAAFLELGVALGELSVAGGRFRIAGGLARIMADPDGDDMLAMAQELAGLHAPYLLAVLGDAGAAASLAALTRSCSAVIARSSRIVEPVLGPVVDDLAARAGQGELLEIGCGSGVYLLRALAANAGLRAVGVEMEPEVARGARRAVERAGLAERAEVLAADVRELDFPGRFALITLHNNIYYFPETDRPAFLARLRSWLKPGGRLVVSTICPGPGVFARFMTLWSVATEGAGALPDPARFPELLTEAGFLGARAERPLPVESFYVFTGENPA